MGSERFRLSDTMVSSWFNKLKGMRRANGRRSITHDGKQGDLASATLKPPPKQKQQEEYLPNRSSYYYSSRERTEKLPHSPINTKASDTSFPVESPRMFDQRPRRGHPKASVKSISPAGTAGCTCHSNLGSVRKYGVVPDRSACFDHSSSVSSAFEGFEDMSEVNLPPILTKPSKKDVHNEELNSTGTRRTTPRKRTLRIKVRPRSLRTSGKRSQKSCTLEAAVPRFAVQQQQQQQQKKDISDSLIVVMLSSDPKRDFRASMLEMIAENDITRPKDLEQLLACYLSLNSEEYHGIIIQVFKQIWFDLMLI